MPNTETLYTPRFQLAELLEQGRNQEVQAPVYRAGALASPTQGASSIVSLFNAANEAVIDAAGVTVTGSIARYTVTSAMLATQTRGDRWRFEWSLLMPDGVVHTFRNDALLVRRRLYPVVTEADLYRRVKALDPSGTAPLTTNTDFADKLDEAFVEIQGRLIEETIRPNLVLAPSALRAVHMALTLAMIFEDQSTRTNAAYADRGKEFRAEYNAAWGRLSFPYDDPSDDGHQQSSNRRGGSRVVWTNGRT